MQYVATCRRCSLQVSTENQAALDEVVDALQGTSGCEHDRGHDLKQILPP